MADLIASESSSESPELVSALPGYFQTEPEPCLLGTHCSQCRNYFFPPLVAGCANPGCDAGQLEPVPLSRRGQLWSLTTNHYPAPAPFLAEDPFEPYTIVAVELEREKLVVLGRLAASADPQGLKLGDLMELGCALLSRAQDSPQWIWEWAPVAGAPPS